MKLQQTGTCAGAKVWEEVFWARLRRCGESLQKLTEDTESTAYMVSLGANPYLLTVMLCDQFTDVLDSPHLEIQVKQDKPAALLQALASALECKSLVKAAVEALEITRALTSRHGVASSGV